MTKTIVFDLDGVFFDSKENMRKSWDGTSTRHNLGVPFNDYFSLIGRPFEAILHELEIKPELHESVRQAYFSISEKFKIELFAGISESIQVISREFSGWSVLTGKPFERTRKLLDLYNLSPSTVITPEYGLPGKPSPEGLLEISRINGITPSEVMFVGDMEVDYVTAKEAGSYFLWATWGYGSPVSGAQVANNPRQMVRLLKEWKESF